MKRNLRFFLFLVIAGAVYVLIFKNLDLVLNLLPGQSELVRYERSIKRNFGKEKLKEWQAASKLCFQDYVEVELPYQQEGYFFSNRIESFGYRVALNEGESVSLQLVIDDESVRAFMEVYQIISNDPDNWILIASSEMSAPAIHATIERSGNYFIKVQPMLNVASRYRFIAKVGPTISFPVLGKGNKAVQSFWGDPRDGGRRKHEGIDIFAPKGTPVLACIDGKVSRIKTGGLGGKVIWLKSMDAKYSYYYAHLDSRSVRQGQQVRVGDEIGKVGNTGNAQSTPPHLHFGIYKAMGKAVDPFPFVKIQNENPEKPAVIASAEMNLVKTIRRQTPLLSNASRNADVIISIAKDGGLYVLGSTKEYYHVRTEDGVAGFVRASLL